MTDPIRFTILGEPASKANTRKLAPIGGRWLIVQEDDLP